MLVLKRLSKPKSNLNQKTQKYTINPAKNNIIQILCNLFSCHLLGFILIKSSTVYPVSYLIS